MFWENFISFIVGGFIAAAIMALSVLAFLFNPILGGIVFFLSFGAAITFIMS